MDMNVITSAASTALANIVLAVIALAGAQVKAQTKQIEDKTARELLENALDDVVNLATVSVNAMEQTTAQAIGNPLEEFPEWVQPIGAHDAYSKDAKTSHNGKKWVSEVDGNVWEPGVYGWAEYSEPEPQEAPQEAQGGASEEPGE